MVIIMQKPLNYVTLTPQEAWSSTLILEDVWEAREAVISDSFPFESFRNLLHRTTSRLVSNSVWLLVLDNNGSRAFLLFMNLHCLLSERKLLFAVLRCVNVVTLKCCEDCACVVWMLIGYIFLFFAYPVLSVNVISSMYVFYSKTGRYEVVFQTWGRFQNGSGRAVQRSRFPFSSIFLTDGVVKTEAQWLRP